MHMSYKGQVILFLLNTTQLYDQKRISQHSFRFINLLMFTQIFLHIKPIHVTHFQRLSETHNAM